MNHKKKKTISSNHHLYRKRRPSLESKEEKIYEANKNRKNHVSENDLSPSGFPFHFAGPSRSK